jgi:hypothetical protein
MLERARFLGPAANPLLLLELGGRAEANQASGDRLHRYRLTSPQRMAVARSIGGQRRQARPRPRGGELLGQPLDPAVPPLPAEHHVEHHSPPAALVPLGIAGRVAPGRVAVSLVALAQPVGGRLPAGELPQSRQQLVGHRQPPVPERTASAFVGGLTPRIRSFSKSR